MQFDSIGIGMKKGVYLGGTVAKQHPQTGRFGHGVTNTSKINYYILRMEIEGLQTQQIWGLLTETEFLAKTKELNIQNIKFSKKYKVDDN